MQVTPNETDHGASDRPRVWWTLALAALVPATIITIGETSHPQLAYVFIPVAFLAVGVIAAVLRRRNRENTDERVRDMFRKATSFSWQVTLAVLGAAGLWMYFQHGMRAVAPYELPVATLIGSYAVALLWQRWRSG